MSGSSPILQAASLWERTSAKGTRYMSGRLGGVRVVIMPNRDFAEDDAANSHTHILYFQDGSTSAPGRRPPNARRLRNASLDPAKRPAAGRSKMTRCHFEKEPA
jgi:hypothetical protein